MKYTSKAIALTYIKQGDSSIISKIFTKKRGLQTFIVKSVRSKNSKKTLAYFEPLKLLNIEAGFNSKKSLQYLSEISIAKHFESSTNKIYKNFIGFFIAEVSARVLQENEQNPSLFNFLWEKGKAMLKSMFSFGDDQSSGGSEDSWNSFKGSETMQVIRGGLDHCRRKLDATGIDINCFLFVCGRG